MGLMQQLRWIRATPGVLFLHVDEVGTGNHTGKFKSAIRLDGG
jgi:hypothetical protein